MTIFAELPTANVKDRELSSASGLWVVSRLGTAGDPPALSFPPTNIIIFPCDFTIRRATMVSTRSKKEFTEPELTPTKSTPARSRKSSAKWAHTPSNVTLIWLAISLPLVIWDAGYVLLRPHSMPGGSLHWPIWAPYELYGTVDYIYGWKAYNERNGFTGAQTALNVVETAMYFYYLYVLYAYGKPSSAPGRGAPKPAKIGYLGEQRYVAGQEGALAVLVAFSAAVMTVSKTVLYWLNEYYSGFDNIGHNKFVDLIFLWIIPNGAWLVLPSYMIYICGSEILQGLVMASGKSSSSENSVVKSE
ncbi:hypothetical protein BP5796_04754 [Coleophoma crateriformis]|uniref:C6 transcription factor n=1 Tax=Coleophoma crateriformis TaxID=565419 RepID=A0A3D8SAG5_9HELO|nr:hypothetical protein BP5796_04754 [Coleophoma crateriformis]